MARLCVPFIILLATQVFSCVYGLICFILIMRFGNSLDAALLEYQHDLVCLFSSEAHGAVELKPGECFNYNHSITTLCFKVKEVDCHKGSEGKHMPTITCNDPLPPCFSTHSWCPVPRDSEIIETSIIALRKKIFLLIHLINSCCWLVFNSWEEVLSQLVLLHCCDGFPSTDTAKYWFYCILLVLERNQELITLVWVSMLVL